ncbi:MAG: FtsQ-type POTRA domain-containing protein [Nitrospinaceae bacterium]|nr:FtsQ-type POTRA domain-containing protein [Nitrospinaceae bacterium]NIR57529.1 FtsQ-type POTRA domain-containing protein [Nitrospinaceae bacterium]NIS88398.1 FtsQ-type POTRA domain-containing protein [Nitrospinaceae bacterium]NIT84863.1 FtsQ-type POTRA domain-containing protein [Nitrospinaceae bacterium]NIU47429.1 FtsQ-type POTRA domain-containing protein [Nitrospinaceae bacterium]
MAGSNIFLLDIEDVSARLAGHPWVRSASVRKAYPQTLEVNVVERTPYARIEMDRVYVMDNYGVLLAADGPEYQDLPLIAKPYGEKPALGENAAGEGVIRAFQIMHYLNRLPLFQHNPVGAARVDRAHRVQFQTRDSGMTIVMPLDTISESFEHLLIVLDILKQKAATLERIDLSFRDQVVIRDPKSTSPSNHFS